MKAFCFFTLFIALTVQGTELRMKNREALKLGFKPKQLRIIDPVQINWPAEQLAWPVEFIDQRHTIGNSMPQYQNYGSEAYYHAGADLRVARAKQITAPIDGFLEGGYYTYVTDQNTGEDKKYTKPITEGGDELYFEITLKTEDGYLLEFHHVNPNQLPKAIYELILRGGGHVRQGDVLGTTAVWPVSRFGERYDHIHYNIISPNGAYMNPEFFSKPIFDNSPPIIKNIFAVYHDRTVEVKNNKLEGLPLELIVSAIDMKGANIYPLPPVVVEASTGLLKLGWDFSQVLLNTVGKFPDIREVFARNLKLTDGRSFTTRGDYNNTVFLFRLKVATLNPGPISLSIRDSAGNENKVRLEVIGPE